MSPNFENSNKKSPEKPKYKNNSLTDQYSLKNLYGQLVNTNDLLIAQNYKKSDYVDKKIGHDKNYHPEKKPQENKELSTQDYIKQAVSHGKMHLLNHVPLKIEFNGFKAHLDTQITDEKIIFPRIVLDNASKPDNFNFLNENNYEFIKKVINNINNYNCHSVTRQLAGIPYEAYNPFSLLPPVDTTLNYFDLINHGYQEIKISNSSQLKPNDIITASLPPTDLSELITYKHSGFVVVGPDNQLLVLAKEGGTPDKDKDAVTGQETLRRYPVTLETPSDFIINWVSDIKAHNGNAYNSTLNIMYSEK